MPLQDGLLIAVKDGVVELTANLVEPHRDDPAEFGQALQQRVAEHQYQSMTDDAIMGEDLALSSCIVCRDPVPDILKDPLVSLGFSPQSTPGGGQVPKSLFGRLGSSKQRARLEKWALRYARSADLHPALGEFETAIVEALPEGSLVDVGEEGVALVVDAARTYFRLLIAPRIESLEALEQHIERLRRTRQRRWVLHPSAVRALAAFTASAILTEAPRTRWSNDPDSPLSVQTAQGVPVSTDPEYRVVEFVRRGMRSALSAYAYDVILQSENR